MTANEVKIKVTADTRQAQAQLAETTRQFNAMRETGEKVSQLGTRLSAALTLPIVGLGAALGKMGTDSVKVVSDLQKNLQDAIAKGDNAAIASAQAALNALSPAVTKAAAAYQSMQAAIAPVNAEIEKMGAELLTALVPVIQQLVPIIKQFVDSLAGVVKWFTSLDTGQKNLVVGLALFAASIGPVIVIIGQLIGTIGTVGVLFGGLPALTASASAGMAAFGVATAAALGPIGALIIAVTTLITLLNSDFGKSGIEAGRQLLSMAAGGIGALVTGDQARGTYASQRAYTALSGTRAQGGPVERGKPYLVGEKGPEVFTPSVSGNIIPNMGIAKVTNEIMSSKITANIARAGKISGLTGATISGGSIPMTRAMMQGFEDGTSKATDFSKNTPTIAPKQAYGYGDNAMGAPAISPKQAYGGGGSTTVQVVYSPQFSTASQYEFQQNIKPLIEQVLRQRNGR